MSDQLTDQTIEEVAQPEPQVTPEPVAAPEPPKPAEPPKEVSLRDQLKAVSASVNAKLADKAKAQPQPQADRARDPETGKFVPQQAAPPKVEQPKEIQKPVQPAQQGTEPPKPQAQVNAVPGTWRAEAKAKWDGLDPVVKAEVLKRESEATREVTKYQQQIQQINQAYGPIEQVIAGRRAAWRATFGSEAEALNKVLNISDFASQDPNGFLAFYLSQPDIGARVDLQKVFGGQAPQGGDIMSHPVVKQLQETVNGLNQRVSGFFTQHQQTQQSTVEREIAEFAQAVDGQGQLLRPHFDAVRQEMFNAIPAIRSANPNLTTQQAMDKAYAIAVAANPEIGQQVEQQRIQAQREAWEREERAKKAALANKSVVTGPAPTNGQHVSTPSTDDLRANLISNFRAWNQGNQPRI